MPTAREKLAAIRAQQQLSAKDKLAAIRAQSSDFREATLGENLRAGASQLVTHAATSIPQAVALGEDVVRLLPRAAAHLTKKALGSDEEFELLPTVRKVNDASTKAGKFVQEKIARVDPKAITDVSEAIGGGIGDVLGPSEAKALSKIASKAARVTARATRKLAVETTTAAPKTARVVTEAAQSKADEVASAVDAAPDAPITKYAEPSAINLERLDVSEEAKRVVAKTSKEIGPELAKAKGAPLTHEEIIESAKTSDILRKVTTRAQTKRRTAAILRSRQAMAKMAEEGKVTPEFIRSIQEVSAVATDAGRTLNAFKIGAGAEGSSLQGAIVKKLLDIGMKAEEITKAAEGVDFRNAKQATEFYRKFVKPTWGEVLDEFRYINMLSSPKTHIINAFSNTLQTLAVRPGVRLLSGVIDNVASGFTGKARAYYVSQASGYVKGGLNSAKDAAGSALRVLKGDLPIEQLDLQRIPTNSPLTKPFIGVTRLLEAGDVFFRTIAEAGEREALAVAARKSGQAVNEAQIAEQARKNAAEIIFRREFDGSNESGQGLVLSQIDAAIEKVVAPLQQHWATKWFVPFVRTPANIAKQGLEFSPAGLATLPGNTKKIEQLSKAMIGSTVFAGAAALALEGRTTWGVPKNRNDRKQWFAHGMQPYSIRVGDTWVSYSKLGPLAYPIAMAAAMKHYGVDDPSTAGKGDERKAMAILFGVAEFFGDQSYAQSLGDLIATAKGDEDAQGRFLAAPARQLVPLSALQSWVARIVDPVYRKVSKDGPISSAADREKQGIPYASKTLEPYEDEDGRPSKRPYPAANAVSPVNVAPVNEEKLKRFREYQRERRENQ
jgi:hypothetical protein